MKTILFYLSVFVIVVITGNSQAQTTFSNNLTIKNQAGSPETTEPVDIDNDGDLDVLYARTGDTGIYWKENDGFGNFIAEHAINTDINNVRTVYYADFNNDNNIDVICGSQNDTCLVWFENINNGTSFIKHIINNNAINLYSLSASDINNDTYSDIVYTSGDSLFMYLGNGNGTFQSRQLISDSTIAYCLSLGDINNDGNIDIVYSDYWNDRIGWLENSGNANFNQNHLLLSGANATCSAYICDIDNDGQKDVLATTEFSPNEIFWFKNNGSGNFSSKIHISNNFSNIKDAFPADFDNDGDIDIVAGGYNRIYWYENDGSQNFSSHILLSGCSYAWKVRPADFDNDGDNDILAILNSNNKVLWFKNKQIQACHIASYKFNNNTNDTTINNLDGINYGAAYTYDRFFNNHNSLSVTTSNYVENRDSALSYNCNTDASISVWFRFLSLYNDTNVLVNLYNQSSFDYASNFTLGLIRNGANNADTIIIVRDTHIDVPEFTKVAYHFDNQIWYHLVVTRNFTTSKYDVYVNNQLISSPPFNNNQIYTTYDYQAITISSPASNLRFNGYIDDVDIYSCTINSTTIDSLYHINNWDSHECLAASYLLNHNLTDETGINDDIDPYPSSSVNYTKDRFGNNNFACEVDTESYIDIYSNQLNLNNNFSLSYWAKFDTLHADTTYFLYDYKDLYEYTNFVLYFNKDGELLLGSGYDTLETINGTGFYISPHKTYHFVIIGDTSANLTSIYANTELVYQETYTPLTGTIIGTGEEIEFGGYNGTVDDINIYRCVLPQETIDSLYYVGDWDNNSCLVATYLLNNNINDNSGNNHNAFTLNPLPSSFVNDRFDMPNSAMYIDDSLGFASISSIYNITDDMSLSFWLNIDTLTRDTTYISALVSFDNDFFNYIIAIEKTQHKLLFGQGTDETGLYCDYFNSEYSLNLHETYHIVVIRDETTHKLYFYVNNELVNTVNYTTNINYYLGQEEILVWGAIDSLDLTVDDINLYRCKIDEETIDSLYHVGNWNGDCFGLAINSLSINDATCGQANGTGFVDVTGGSGNYTYLWSDGSTTNIATLLEGGSNTIQINDTITGCTITQFFNVNNSNAPSISINTLTNINCYGGNNGEITTDVTGGTGSYTYNWSTGEHNENISNLYAGTYELTVIDEANCIVTETFTITQPDELTLSFNTTNSDCNSSNGTAKAIVAGGTPNYTYSWGTGTDTINNVTAGSYPLTITDAHNCSIEGVAMVSDNGAPIITIDSIIAGNCNNNGAIYVTIENAIAPTFEWNGISTISEDLDTATANTNYTLTVQDGNCTAMQNIFVPYILPEAQEICIVTVDSTTNANLVVWEKPITTDIKGYNIYRETSIPEEYVQIGYTPYDSLGVFVDDMAYPWIRSYKYKIASVDNCDVISELSEAHKTIHVNLNVGYLQNTINLNWDDYFGFTYSTFHALRYDVGTGWNDVAGSPMPNNLHSITADVYSNTVTFAITVDKPGSACFATKESGGPYSHSLSNLDDYSLGTFNTIISDNNNINIYPNPTKSIINIKGDNIQEITITDIRGQIISKQVVNSNYYSINMKYNAKGIYFIKISGKNYSIVKKFILE